MFSIQLLDPSLAGWYERFAFPWQRDSLPEKCLDQLVVALAAARLLEQAGLVIASVKPETQTGVIDSLFVGYGFRNSGIGTGLLLAAGEHLREKGCRRVSISFPVGRRENSALCRILQKCGWDEPVKSHEIGKFKFNESFLWVNRVGFRGNDRAIPWNEPAPKVLEEIKKGEDKWYPRRFSPFQGGRPYPDTSFWLCCDGEIVGWLITARVAEDTLCYGIFYVRKELQKTGRAIPLLAQAIKKQLELGIHYACCSVNYHPDRSNSDLRRFYEKRLKPNAILLVEFYQAEKQF
jgi:GNAT superfamily N-acetyltransferase